MGSAPFQAICDHSAALFCGPVSACTTQSPRGDGSGISCGPKTSLTVSQLVTSIRFALVMVSLEIETMIFVFARLILGSSLVTQNPTTTTYLLYRAAARHRPGLHDNKIPRMSRQAPVVTTSLAARARSLPEWPCQNEERLLSSELAVDLCLLCLRDFAGLHVPHELCQDEGLDGSAHEHLTHWETPHDAAIFFGFYCRRIGNPRSNVLRFLLSYCAIRRIRLLLEQKAIGKRSDIFVGAILPSSSLMKSPQLADLNSEGVMP